MNETLRCVRCARSAPERVRGRLGPLGVGWGGGPAGVHGDRLRPYGDGVGVARWGESAVSNTRAGRIVV